MNFLSLSTALRASTIFFCSLYFLSSSQGQIDLADKAAVATYLEGTWELKSHYYGIGGWLDEYPTVDDSYHYTFETTDVDSIMRMSLYHNLCWQAESDIVISEQKVGADNYWQLSDFVRFDGSIDFRFAVSPQSSTADTAYLFQDYISDGSSYTIERSTADLSDYCQVPENFEFVDHTEKCHNHAGAKLLQDGVIYGTNYYNKSWDFRGTAIKIARFDNSVTTVYNSQWQTDLFLKEPNDSTFIYVLANFWDYDTGYSGFTALTFVNEELRSTEPFEFSSYQNVIDVSSGKNNTWWALSSTFSGTELLHIENGFQKTIPIDNNYSKLFLDHNEELYLFGGTKIAKVVNDSLQVFKELEHQILDITSVRNETYILSENQITRNTSTFHPYDTLEIAPGVGSFRQAQIFPSSISLLYQENSLDYIANYSFHNNSISSTLLTSTEGEIFLDLEMSKKETALISGELGCQIFFRQVNMDENKPNNYLKENLAIENFTIEGMPVSTGVETQDYKVTIEVKNEGVTTIDFSDAFSSNYMVHGIDITTYIDFDILNSLAPNESRVLTTEITTTKGTDFNYMLMTIPGANHRFNESEDWILPVTFSSSLKDLHGDHSYGVFPNPSNGNITIKSNEKLETVSIYNSSGQLQYYQTGAQISPVLKLDNLSNGQYFLLIKEKGSEKLFSEKLIISK